MCLPFGALGLEEVDEGEGAERGDGAKEIVGDPKE